MYTQTEKWTSYTNFEALSQENCPIVFRKKKLNKTKQKQNRRLKRGVQYIHFQCKLFTTTQIKMRTIFE